MNSKETGRELRELVRSLRRAFIATVLLAAFWSALYSAGVEIPVITKFNFGRLGYIDVFSIPMWLNIMSVPAIVFCLHQTWKVLDKSDREYDDMILSFASVCTPILSLFIALVIWSPDYHLELPPGNSSLSCIAMALLVARIISPYILLQFGLFMTLSLPHGPIIGVFTLLLFLTCPKIWREIIAKLRTIELPELEPSRQPFLLPPKWQWLKRT